MQEENTLSDRPAVSPSRKDTTMSHIDELRAAAADYSRFTAVAYEIAFGDRRVRIAELHEIAADHIAIVFDVSVPSTTVNDIKHEMAKKYEPTYRAILEKIASGPVVHADETKGVVWRWPLCLDICQSEFGRLRVLGISRRIDVK
jgi:hypothetical protein